MNFVIKNFDTEKVNIEKYTEILRKAEALTKDINTILNICGDTEKKYGVEYTISYYADDNTDEFEITRYSHANNMAEYYRVEVVNNSSIYTNIGDTGYSYRQI